MSLRHLDRAQGLRRCSAVSALALAAAACSTTTVVSRPRPPGVAEMQGREEPSTFTFPAPSGTQFVWTERRLFDAHLAGTSAAERDVTELAWDVSMHPSSLDTVVIDERLVRIAFDHDGRTVVSGAPDALVQLVIDSGGTIEEVRGVDQAARVVRSMAAPGMEAFADRMFSPAALRALVAARQELFFGQIVGRPTREGATWIIPHREHPAGNELMTRYTVEGSQPCDASPSGAPTLCSQLRAQIEIDPRVAMEVAGALVERQLRLHGGNGAALSVRSGGYGMTGTILVQPATLLMAEATLHEAGRVSFAADGRQYDVDIRAVTRDRYDYGPSPAVAER
jgi:hypothetical protein